MHTDPSIVFLAGTPRSGSTLLANLLGQNPGLHVTPTSGLPEAISQIRDGWWQNVAWKAQGLSEVKPRILSMIAGMVHGYYADEIARGRTVIDKSKAWLRLIPQMEAALGRRIQVIVTVRDVRSIIASMELRVREAPWTVQDMGPFRVDTSTVEGRADAWLAPDGMIGTHLVALRNAWQIGLADRLLIVPYRALTDTPLAVMADLESRLSLAPHRYDPDHVEQVTHEDDDVHGLELHKIRPVIESPPDQPWEGILPSALADRIDEAFADINHLARGSAAGMEYAA